MSYQLPKLIVPRRPAHWDSNAAPQDWPWQELSELQRFTQANGIDTTEFPTHTRVCYDDNYLYSYFECEDPYIWGTYTQRDEPIYDQEVVEIFIGVGSENPIDYYEFQVSPDGVLFDAKIHNPHSQRGTIKVGVEWNSANIKWWAKRDDSNNTWWAMLALPWHEIGAQAGEPLPQVWRANFYRIERPENREPDYSCWSPTHTDPADYHKPAYFGILELGE